MVTEHGEFKPEMKDLSNTMTEIEGEQFPDEEITF